MYTINTCMFFPLDCLGEIIEFVSAPKIIISFLSTSKAIKNLIEKERPCCCKGVTFQMKNIPASPKKYVYTISIWDRTITLSKIFYVLFKNLTSIKLHGNTHQDSLILSYSLCTQLYIDNEPYIHKRIRKLTIIHYYIEYVKLNNFTELTHLHIDFITYNHEPLWGLYISKLNKLQYLRGRSIYITDKSELINKKDLVYLEIGLMYKDVSEDMFKNMNNLHTLIIHRGNPTITEKTFKYLPNLETFDAREITSITSDVLQHVRRKMKVFNISTGMKIPRQLKVICKESYDAMRRSIMNDLYVSISRDIDLIGIYTSKISSIYSSISDNIDRIISTYNKKMSLSIDCLGEIVQYIGDGSDILNLTLTCKVIKNFIEKTYPKSCENATFTLKQIPSQQLKYIHKIHLKNKQVVKGIAPLGHLPNITELHINGEIIADHFHFNMLKNLKVLMFDDMYEKPVHGIHIRDLNKLKTLYGKCIVINDVEDLINKKDMEILMIGYMDDDVDGNVFSNMSKLIQLSIYKGNPTITQKTLIKLTELETLELNCPVTITDTTNLEHMGRKLKHVKMFY